MSLIFHVPENSESLEKEFEVQFIDSLSDPEYRKYHSKQYQYQTQLEPIFIKHYQKDQKGCPT